MKSSTHKKNVPVRDLHLNKRKIDKVRELENRLFIRIVIKNKAKVF